MPKKAPIKCPYCKQVRKTNTGLMEHIRNRHPWNITPSGILLANKETNFMQNFLQK